MKKAMTVVMAPILPFRAKREEIRGRRAAGDKRADDQTRAADDGQRAADFANWSMIVPSPRETAMTMAIVPRMATSGTAM